MASILAGVGVLYEAHAPLPFSTVVHRGMPTRVPEVRFEVRTTRAIGVRTLTANLPFKKGANPSWNNGDNPTVIQHLIRFSIVQNGLEKTYDGLITPQAQRPEA